ncbi:Beta-ketoacyl synthase domain-containing protein [Rozella allomycis CSF55]|uniref:beta-ketoacyl-[acyl-carrier-protein] synthase I n=1 Tax=Rozella allomycis (strain CSF55) TaxID=988480 RepID=A0A075B1R8_ROZAC|nr:Beta-ketoacyl synthase domain-containing protein [Rozella allomycis CSF55]|eukprot:EPZ34733.1 Beta-ketoacyl synthase domain-containing protein [Rozella allomycis CSF55]
MAARKVVVTGVGTVNPLGNSVKESFENLISGKCGISKLTGEEFAYYPSKVAARITNFANSDESIPKFIQYSLHSTEEAVKMANLDLKAIDLTRLGVCFGTGLGNLEYICQSHDRLKESYRKLSAYTIPYILNNAPAGFISKQYQCHAFSHSVSTACTTGLHSIIDAFRYIQSRDADIVIAGATEPHRASRPFDADRCGFVVGEGSGTLVIESLEHALSRGAKILAEICGYGLSSDAYHMTSPFPEGEWIKYSMRNALRGIGNINLVDYINAHATSTVAGDIEEAKAIESLFGSDILVSSCKGSIGHLLGAAGAVELIFTIMSMNKNVAPPNLNLERKANKIDLKNLPKKAIEKNIRYALSNSFGFYGTNASIVLKKNDLI